MTNLLDFIMDLFRSPESAARFVLDPDNSLRDAGLPNVTAAQLQAVAATAAPAGLILGGGNPVQGLQQAVASHHNIASPTWSPQNTFAPQTQTDFASHNNTPIASNNDLMSPDQSAGANAQNGAFNLGFGDITLGDKTSNTATEGGVVNTGNAGDIDTTSVKGNGNVVGDDNNANTGTVVTGSHGSTTIGEGNGTEISDSSQHAGGDVVSDNEGPVIKDNDMSGGHGGNAGADGGGSLIGIGNGGNEANAGGGGGGGSIILTDSHSNTNSGNTSVAGNQTTVGQDYAPDSSVNTNVQTTNEYQTDNSIDDHSYSDSSFTSNVASHNDTDIASNNETASHNDTASNNSSEMDAF